jgi:predicted metalloendopeptidase
MDVDHIEEIGGSPLRPWLALIDAISDKPALLKAVAAYNKHQVNNLFTWGVSTDPRNHSRNIFSIGPPPVSLPDKKYYLEDKPDMRKHRTTLVTVMTRFFQLVGYDEVDAASRARRVLEFETKVAEITPEKDEQRHDHGENISWEDLGELTPWWPWRDWISDLAKCTPPPDGSSSLCPHDHVRVRAVGSSEGVPLYLYGRSFFERYNALLEETELETYRALLVWKLVQSAVIYLSSPYIDLEAAMRGEIAGSDSMEAILTRPFNASIQGVCVCLRARARLQRQRPGRADTHVKRQ